MTHVRRPVLRVASLLGLAACQLAGCGDETSPHGREPGLFDPKSPFVDPAPARARACSAQDHAAAIAVWTRLRTEDYPYHLQTVALSPPLPGGCRALIITEPPPSVSLAALRELAPRLMASAEIRQHEVGYDGWTRDVVVTLPPVDDAELTDLIAGLHTTMFDTTYRMATLDTSQPVPAYDPAAAPLDLAIGPGELHRWLVKGAARFTPLGGGEPASFKDLLASTDPEVYLDDADGLVAWVVPRDADLADMAALFRQFAVESDLIIGAMASDTALAIVARQRAIDPLILQPLRFEVVSLLAAVHDRPELQQSYERTHPLASRIDDTQDWAPIFLSPELVDTEYGSLLDIADQLLKSWSNNGKTQYTNFAYPPPTIPWAFPDPVFKVAHAHRFRYNWNTDHAGAVVSVDGVDVFWLRRTGALNVSYFPDEDELAEHPAPRPPEVQSLEETAYQFFARTQTPFLARVVEYNALFQIFARFGVTSSMQVPVVSRAAAARTLAAAVRDTLVAIRDAGGAEIERRLATFTGAEPGARARAIDDTRGLAARLAKLDDKDLDELGRMLGDSQTATRRQDLVELCKQARRLGSAFARFARPEIYKAYAQSAAVKSDAWIHTPAVVISWYGSSTESVTGGHDLRAQVDDVKFHAERPAIAADRLARHLPVDAVGAKELEVLELGPSGPRLARAPAHRAARSALGGSPSHGFWPAPGRRVKPPSGGLHEASVTKLSDGYRVHDWTGKVHEVTTMPEVVELIRGGHRSQGEQVTIHFEGFHSDEVRRTIRTAQIHTTADIAGVTKPLPGFANQPLDFDSATLGETRIRTYHDGAGAIGHVLVVPGSNPSKPISIAVNVAVRRGTTGVLRSLGGKIRAAIGSVIARFSGKRVSPFDVARTLRTRLRGLLRDELPGHMGRKLDAGELDNVMRIELKMQQETADVVIVQRELPASHGTCDLSC